MIRLPNDPDAAALMIAQMIRRTGLREVSRRTGIPLTTVARQSRNIADTRFGMVLKLIKACNPKQA